MNPVVQLSRAEEVDHHLDEPQETLFHQHHLLIVVDYLLASYCQLCWGRGTYQAGPKFIALVDIVFVLFEFV